MQSQCKISPPSNSASLLPWMEHRNCQTGSRQWCISNSGQYKLLWRTVQETLQKAVIKYPAHNNNFFLISVCKRLVCALKQEGLNPFQTSALFVTLTILTCDTSPCWGQWDIVAVSSTGELCSVWKKYFLLSIFNSPPFSFCVPLFFYTKRGWRKAPDLPSRYHSLPPPL